MRLDSIIAICPMILTLAAAAPTGSTLDSPHPAGVHLESDGIASQDRNRHHKLRKRTEPNVTVNATATINGTGTGNNVSNTDGSTSTETDGRKYGTIKYSGGEQSFEASTVTKRSAISNAYGNNPTPAITTSEMAHMERTQHYGNKKTKRSLEESRIHKRDLYNAEATANAVAVVQVNGSNHVGNPNTKSTVNASNGDSTCRQQGSSKCNDSAGYEQNQLTDTSPRANCGPGFDSSCQTGESDDEDGSCSDSNDNNLKKLRKRSLMKRRSNIERIRRRDQFHLRWTHNE